MKKCKLLSLKLYLQWTIILQKHWVKHGQGCRRPVEARTPPNCRTVTKSSKDVVVKYVAVFVSSARGSSSPVSCSSYSSINSDRQEQNELFPFFFFSFLFDNPSRESTVHVTIEYLSVLECAGSHSWMAKDESSGTGRGKNSEQRATCLSLTLRIEYCT